MPCCGRAGSTLAYCRRCIEIICEQGRGAGRCPSCREYIAVKDGGVVVTENRPQCRMCWQERALVDQGLCDACLLGAEYCFRYECDQCHGVQQIPHPMWRYQASPSAFGIATWACHAACGGQTHWRITPEDVTSIPLIECPEAWGRRETWLAVVQHQRRMEISARIPVDKPVTIRRLLSQPGYNGRVGKVLGHDSATGKVSVLIPGAESTVALEPANLTQHVSRAHLALDGAEVCIGDFDDDLQCYKVVHSDTYEEGSTCQHASPEDIRLPEGTVVRVVRLVSDFGQMFNGCFGSIVSFEEGRQRYVVQLGGARRMLKPANVQP